MVLTVKRKQQILYIILYMRVILKKISTALLTHKKIISAALLTMY